jgi:TRAP-type C4-dicarboxylate transport system permease small subunit
MVLPRLKTSAGLLIDIPATIVIFVMLVHVTANALLRTFAGAPLEYTLEIVQYWYMPFLVFLGFIAAQRRGQHISTDLIFGKFPDRSKRYVVSITFAVCAVLTALLATYGYGTAVEMQQINKHAGVTPVPSWPTYYLVPLAFGVMTLQLVYESVQVLRGKSDLGLLSEEEQVAEELELAEEIVSREGVRS